jgi:hypothetical protein
MKSVKTMVIRRAILGHDRRAVKPREKRARRHGSAVTGAGMPRLTLLVKDFTTGNRHARHAKKVQENDNPVEAPAGGLVFNHER